MSPTNKTKLLERRQKLQSAINHISSVRKVLSKNAQEIKCQIHANISRQLEALRNREVWLLNQVDLLQSAKEEVLRNQQARLDTSLGSVNKTLEILADCERELDECDDSSDEENLKPEATPHLTFQVNSVGLREKIMRYGKIESTGFPDKSIFTGRHESASLPKAFEDDEDGDHEMLTKSVSRQPGSVSVPGSFRRCLPKTSSGVSPTPLVNNWLDKLSSSNSPITVSASPSASLKSVQAPKSFMPTLRDDLSSWLHQPESVSGGLRHVASDASIRSWLYQLKTSPHMEEDDEMHICDRMSTTSDTTAHGSRMGTPSRLTLQSVQLPKQRSTCVTAFIKSLLTQDTSRWLKKTAVVADMPQENVHPKISSNIHKYYAALMAQSDDKWIHGSKIDCDNHNACNVDHIPNSKSCLLINSIRSGISNILHDSKLAYQPNPRVARSLSDCTNATGTSTLNQLHKYFDGRLWLQSATERSSQDSSRRNSLAGPPQSTSCFQQLRFFQKSCEWVKSPNRVPTDNTPEGANTVIANPGSDIDLDRNMHSMLNPFTGGQDSKHWLDLSFLDSLKMSPQENHAVTNMDSPLVDATGDNLKTVCQVSPDVSSTDFEVSEVDSSSVVILEDCDSVGYEDWLITSPADIDIASTSVTMTHANTITSLLKSDDTLWLLQP